MWEIFHKTPRTYWEFSINQKSGRMLCVHVKAWSVTVTLVWLLSLPFLASLCRSVSHPFGLAPPRPPSVLSGVMATDPSSTAYPGIPEQLFGSSASAVREWKDFSFISPSFQNSNKAIIPSRALFFCFPNSKHSVCFSDSWEATLRPIDSQCIWRREREYWICLHYHFPIRVLL